MYIYSNPVEKLLTEPAADSDEQPKEPRLTIEDLVGLISDLAQHNSKRTLSC